MSTSLDKAIKTVKTLNKLKQIEKFIKESKGKLSVNDNVDSVLPTDIIVSEEGQQQRILFLKNKTDVSLDCLVNNKKMSNLNFLKGNIENYIGMTQVPTGIIGPVRVLGTDANGDYFVPMATSEGALVASYHRGAKACRLSGGVSSVCLIEGVQRSPVFKFNDLGEVGIFIIWVLKQIEVFDKIISENSKYAKFMDLKTNIEGNHVTLTFEISTGDAAGQNMVTFCVQEVCKYILENMPVKPILWFIESNYSGDKKATSLSFSNVRGKKVTSEVVLPEKIVKEVLKTTPHLIAEYWKTSTLGVIQSGAIGAQGHFANGLAAIFLACGQDVACVSEAAVGITRMELNSRGDLYVSVTLPNLIVGTVGGGTNLPTQAECLKMIDCHGAGKAIKFAEITGAVILAGELSISAALSAGHFAEAHKKLGRKNE